MTDEIKNTETTTANATENTNTSNSNDECRWGRCRPFGRFCGSEHRDWHGKHGKHCCKKKAIIGVVVIALLAFFAGKGCSHHHAEHQRMGYMEQQPTVTQSFNGQVQQMPLSTVLDGIAATPEQRAKAVSLLH